ncbi:MAG TPA: hypothetical protein ENJ45_01960, partial [Phaeodactylibacter sp.]|nr:hypothetical protein [Phaeodactylibacter sp.]
MMKKILLGIYFILSTQVIWAQAKPCTFISQGEMKEVILQGKSWKEQDGAVQGQGKSSVIYAGRFIEEGDFRMKVRMSLEEINKSTALLLFFTNHFGFDSNI